MIEMTIRLARGDADMNRVRGLLREYSELLHVNLCFQDFDAELAGLPGRYAPPSGELLIAMSGAGASEEPAGCIAVRQFQSQEGTCEMKRLFVRPQFRGGLGRRLATAIIEHARTAGYKKMRLDTLPHRWRRIDCMNHSGFAIFRRTAIFLSPARDSSSWIFLR